MPTTAPKQATNFTFTQFNTHLSPEVDGKWRRAQLTSAQLSTYYVGYTEISDLAAELMKAGRDPRTAHDAMLAHGSPPVRLLRTLHLRPPQHLLHMVRLRLMCLLRIRSKCQRLRLRSITSPCESNSFNKAA